MGSVSLRHAIGPGSDDPPDEVLVRCW
jgi:hypothetical protein